jgi:hypothetical protein
MRDSPEAVAAAAAKSREIGAELEGLLAEALVGYQGTLAAALHAIEARMDNLTHGAEGAGGGAGAAGGAERAPPAAGAERDSGGRQDGQEGAGAGALASVMERLASLERSNAKLASELEMVGREVAALVTRAASQADAERPILQDVYNRVKKSADAHTEGEGQQAEGKQPGKTVGDRLPVEGLHLPFIGGAVVLTLVLLLAHMWYRRMPSRKVKV